MKYIAATDKNLPGIFRECGVAAIAARNSPLHKNLNDTYRLLDTLFPFMLFTVPTYDFTRRQISKYLCRLIMDSNSNVACTAQGIQFRSTVLCLSRKVESKRA